MKRVQQGFTLIELMIVVAIVGILAAIALPAYQDYVVRSKMSEAEAAIAACKTSVSEYLSTHPTGGIAAIGSNEAGCSNSATQYVASLDVTAGVITVNTTGTGSKSGGTASDCILTLTPSGYVADSGEITKWVGSYTSCDSKYVPSAFR